MKKRIKPRIIDVIEDDGRWLDPETMEYFEEEQLEDVVDTEDDKNFSLIESLKKEQSPKIKGWMARDEDGALYVFASKPQRAKGIYKEDIWDNGDAALPLPKSIFLDLKWEDEPIEVELTIHRV